MRLVDNCCLNLPTNYATTRPAPFVSTPEGKAFAKRLWAELIATGQRLDKRIGSGLSR